MESLNKLRGTHREFSKYTNNAISWFDDKFGTNPDWIRFKTLLHTAATDWQNLLNNQHALTESDKEVARSVVDPKMPLQNVLAALQEMAHTAAVRIVPLNDQWKSVMGENYPDLLNEEAVKGLKAIGNEDAIRILADMEVGGSLKGSKDGTGTPGKKVRELLGMKEPSESNKPPKGDRKVYNGDTYIFDGEKYVKESKNAVIGGNPRVPMVSQTD